MINPMPTVKPWVLAHTQNMDTVASLARELGMQPHGLAAFADLGTAWTDNALLDPDTVTTIREAFAASVTQAAAHTSAWDAYWKACDERHAHVSSCPTCSDACETYQTLSVTVRKTRLVCAPSV